MSNEGIDNGRAKAFWVFGRNRVIAYVKIRDASMRHHMLLWLLYFIADFLVSKWNDAWSRCNRVANWN